MKHFYLQIKVNKCKTKSGKMSHIALCIVKYFHEKKAHLYINIYYTIKINLFKCKRQQHIIDM